MTVQELIDELRSMADKDAAVVLMLGGQEFETFSVTDYAEEEDPFVAIEAYS